MTSRGKRRERYVRWDKSGIHVFGTRSSMVRGKTWLSIRADVRAFLRRHCVHPIDQFYIIQALEFCTKTTHKKLCEELFNRVTIPGRPARIIPGYRKSRREN